MLNPILHQDIILQVQFPLNQKASKMFRSLLGVHVPHGPIVNGDEVL